MGQMGVVGDTPKIVMTTRAPEVLKQGLDFSAQWYRCQLGCSGSQNLPGSNYRRIICSCSYYMEHAKILL